MTAARIEDVSLGFARVAQDFVSADQKAADAQDDAASAKRTAGRIPQDFGAVSGQDCRQALKDWFAYLTAQGGARGYIPEGTYLLSAGVDVTVSSDVEVTVSPAARFVAMPGFPSGASGWGAAKLFHFAPGSGTGHVFTWRGGKYDGSNIPNSGAGQANDILSFEAGSVCKSVTISLDHTTAGADWLSSGSDSHVFIVADNACVEIKECTGAADCGVYVSGDGSGVGKSIKVRGNYYKCLNGVVVKRDYKQIDIDIYAEDCLNGGGCAHSGDAGAIGSIGARGGNIKVSSRRTNRSAFANRSEGLTITVNALDIGASVGSFLSADASALHLAGSLRCHTTVNVHGVNPACTNTAAFRGVRLVDETHEADTRACADNMVVMNASRIGRPINEEGTSNRNAFILHEYDRLSASVVVGALSSLQTIDATGRHRFQVGNNSPAAQIDGTHMGFGTLVASADAAVTGYITVKDMAGNLRKLAVIS